MSAYIVHRHHIDALVTAGLALPSWLRPLRWGGDELTRHTADAVGAMLLEANVTAIHARYPDTVGGGDYPGPIGFTLADVVSYRFDRLPGVPSAAVVLKAIDGYTYQACEHPSWRETDARRYCDALRHAWVAMVPGYGEAPWQIDGRDAFLHTYSQTTA